MPARGKTRLKELASALGLSITTVSRALAGYPDVSPATRTRVREAAARAGYVPSRAAQMLASGRTDFVGMILPVRDGRLVDAFLGEFASALAEELVEVGRDLLIAAVTPKRSDMDVLKHVIDGHRADALILNRTEVDDRRAAYLLDRGFPFVAHGRLLNERRPYVYYDTDGEGAFAAAARMCVDHGHRRFGLLTIEEPFAFARLRRLGLERALRDAGLALPPHAVEGVPMADPRAAEAAARRLLALDPRPTAIFGIVDSLAVAVLAAAKQLGIAVPQDLSVIGFDDVPVAAYSDPPLSTFAQRTRESATCVVRMLVDVLERGADRVESKLVRAEFVARASHGPAPRSRRDTAA